MPPATSCADGLDREVDEVVAVLECLLTVCLSLVDSLRHRRVSRPGIAVQILKPEGVSDDEVDKHLDVVFAVVVDDDVGLECPSKSNSSQLIHSAAGETPGPGQRQGEGDGRGGPRGRLARWLVAWPWLRCGWQLPRRAS